MQFAGQRTSLELEPVGEPLDILIKMAPDVLPDPGAILVTGITPQKTLEEGISEVEFLELFYKEIVEPGTIFIGYNSVRFDDEFMRFLMWRNFYDPYEWQWKNNCSRWDLLDVVRMTRALRPDGIKWPKDSSGKASNRLELLTKANKIDHIGAHDALVDVNATIAVAQLIKQKQPKLFDYLLNYRDKKSVAELVNSGQPFVYSSGKYSSEFEKTTVAIKLADATSGALVYDLRYDPSEFVELSPSELVERWQFTKDENALSRLPIKTMKFNHCPAVAPLNTLDSASQKRLKLDIKVVEANRKKLATASGFAKKVTEALALMDKKREAGWAGRRVEAEAALYDGFISDSDKFKLAGARDSGGSPSFSDKRLVEIWPRYKARNFTKQLTNEELADWENYCRIKLSSGGDNSRLANYFKQLAELANTDLPKDKQFLLEELQLYGESIMPLGYDGE